LSAIIEFLESVNLSGNFELITKGDGIEIKSIADKEIKKNLEKLAEKRKTIL